MHDTNEPLAARRTGFAGSPETPSHVSRAVAEELAQQALDEARTPDAPPPAADAAPVCAHVMTSVEFCPLHGQGPCFQVTTTDKWLGRVVAGAAVAGAGALGYYGLKALVAASKRRR